MSWERGDHGDMVWGARKLVLDTVAEMEGVMGVIDPIGCYREGVDRDGEPLPYDEEHLSTLQFVQRWWGRLGRVNSMLLELERRGAPEQSAKLDELARRVGRLEARDARQEA